jgi:2-methylcitrate dehydratase PrpD
MQTSPVEIGPVMDRLSAYIARALTTELPPEVIEKAKLHILDTIAAIISGSRLLPGIKAATYARTQGGAPEALVLGSELLTNVVTAALANGMAAHADETDDSHKASRSHPGCGVVPAALALGERNNVDAATLIRAVVLGYDVACRTTPALVTLALYESGHATHSFAALFGAAATASALCGLTQTQARWALSYTAQQASGLTCWRRDRDHIEKAFDFGGMPARNGVAAATMVEAGFTGVDDVLSGPRNFFMAFSRDPQPEILIDGLGSRFEILNTNIKKWTTGTPCQAALDSVQVLARESGFTADSVQKIRVRMSNQEADTINNRDMPDICLQYLTSVLLLDGDLTFHSAHDVERMRNPAVMQQRAKIELISDPAVPRRKPIVEITTTGGKVLTHVTEAVRGTPENPMTREEVENKAYGLIEPIIGTGRAGQLIDAIRSLENVMSVRDLRPLMMA